MSNDSLSVYPDKETYVASANARCLMFYDWENSIGPDWLIGAKEIFNEFGQSIIEGTGNLGSQHSHGKFSRTQKKLTSFLLAVQNNMKQSFEIEIKSQPTVESDAFFPNDIEMAWSSNINGRKEGMIAIRDTLADSCISLIERIGDKLFGMIGASYATSFDFPTHFGPGFYRAGLGTIPEGGDPLVNKTYKARLTQWRDNRRHGLLMNQGYFREIYPINFVLKSHLNMPFQNRHLSEYMSKVGDLKTSTYSDKMYIWAVSEENLDRVRLEMESSGLILSSETPPLVVA